MTRTQKYRLPQWEKADRIMMEDFNGMAAKLETALTAHDTALSGLTSGKADKSTTTSLQNQVNQKANTSTLNSSVSSLQSQINGKIGIVIGQYKGDGQKAQTISLGFQPKAVLVLRADGMVSNSTQGFSGLALPGTPAKYNDNVFLEVTSSGFTVGSGSGGGGWGTFLNDSYNSYWYIAFK